MKHMRWLTDLDGESCMICKENIELHREEVNDKVHIINTSNSCCSCVFMFELCPHVTTT